MVLSSVSPERCDITEVYPAFLAIFTAAIVSVKVPIWFTFTRIELAIPFSIPVDKRSTLVTNKSSPTNCVLSPINSVKYFQPSQSFSCIPSSIEIIGYLVANSAMYSACSLDVLTFPFGPSNFV